MERADSNGDFPNSAQSSPNISTDAGITISINPVSENAPSSSRDNLEPDSMISDVSDPQHAKQPSPNISIVARITISISPVSENACFSSRDNLDPDSNVTEESDPHLAKAFFT
jgi:hypothetical protein